MACVVQEAALMSNNMFCVNVMALCSILTNNGKALLPELRSGERALDDFPWSLCPAVPGTAQGPAGRCQGVPASEASESVGGKASPLGSQAEAAAE